MDTDEIGMGMDNAALAMLFAGCRPEADKEERKRCYERSDAGFPNKATQEGIENAVSEVVSSIVTAEVFSHVQWVPHRRINSYKRDHQAGDFVLHCAGGECGGGPEGKWKYIREVMNGVNWS